MEISFKSAHGFSFFTERVNPSEGTFLFPQDSKDRIERGVSLQN